MNFVHYYQNESDNFGVVEEIYTLDPDDSEDVLVRCSNIGSVAISGCLNFQPKVGDKVELLVAEKEVAGWFLRKVEDI